MGVGVGVISSSPHFLVLQLILNHFKHLILWFTYNKFDKTSVKITKISHILWILFETEAEKKNHKITDIIYFVFTIEHTLLHVYSCLI